jgi:hypothetical protein
MPCLLYCVTRIESLHIPNTVGVGDEIVCSHETSGLRIYWSEITDPATTLAEGTARKSAELKFQQVLREIVVHVTPIPIPFPVVLAHLEALDKFMSEQRGFYCETLNRLANTVQYEMIATWTADEQADLATPVSGREFLKRRQEATDRISAIDSKLRTVTGGWVREWRARQDRRKHHWFALVPRENRERFVTALRTAGPSEGVRLRLSGPWPPSEFVSPPLDSP